VTQKYELVGQLTLGQAAAIAEILGGSVIWVHGHTYPDSGITLRPLGCKCPQCSGLETRCDCGERQRAAFERDLPCNFSCEKCAPTQNRGTSL
jgi:hypothetical protein